MKVVVVGDAFFVVWDVWGGFSVVVFVGFFVTSIWLF